MGQDEAEEAWELGPEGQEAGLTSVRTWDERGCGFRLVDRVSYKWSQPRIPERQETGVGHDRTGFP